MNRHSRNIIGIKLLANDGEVLLEAGCMLSGGAYSGAFSGIYIHQEFPLAQGERLAGVRSKFYDKTAVNSAYHCNMVLVIGWLE